MSENETTRIFENVRRHAVRHLSHIQQHTTNLHLDERIYSAEEIIGPEFQKIVAEGPTILVFADDDPLANFSHDCRYMLYDGVTGEFDREIPAQFPRYTATRPSTLRAFHEPVNFVESKHFPVKPPFQGPVILPDGERYAILFSGMSNKRHLNDMEFLFRTMVDTYGFKKENIFSLSFDGTLNTQDGVQTLWPGDNTPYRINIKHQGSRSALQSAFDELRGRLKTRDELLIHTNNHGGWDNVSGSSFLCTYPSWSQYYATELATKLASLPRYNKLIVMMEQCHAGGFNAPILTHSTAAATSIAAAAIESKSSYVSADGNWDPFARDWIAAQARHTPFGGMLAFNPDADSDGRIQAEEAFAYANFVRDPRDSPVFNESSEAGGDITLGQEFRVFGWYPILVEALRPHYNAMSVSDYHAVMQKIQPELHKLASSLEHVSETMRKEATIKVAALITTTFGKRPRDTDVAA